MILTHDMTLLYVPPNIGTIKGLTPSQEWLPGTARRVLLLRHPLEWLLGYYLKVASPFTFKDWFRYEAPPPQSTLCPSPDEVVRGEFFERDMEELGVHATINLALLPTTDVCSQTRTNILKKYERDYELGDYLGEW